MEHVCVCMCVGHCFRWRLQDIPSPLPPRGPADWRCGAVRGGLQLRAVCWPPDVLMVSCSCSYNYSIWHGKAAQPAREPEALLGDSLLEDKSHCLQTAAACDADPPHAFAHEQKPKLQAAQIGDGMFSCGQPLCALRPACSLPFPGSRSAFI